MLESTNALIGALAAVLRELDRCQRLLNGGQLGDAAEEALGPFVDQLHEALADLSETYEARRAQHPQLLDGEALKRHVLAHLPGEVDAGLSAATPATMTAAAA